jgi:hypothetical protein
MDGQPALKPVATLQSVLLRFFLRPALPGIWELYSGSHFVKEGLREHDCRNPHLWAIREYIWHSSSHFNTSVQH